MLRTRIAADSSSSSSPRQSGCRQAVTFATLPGTDSVRVILHSHINVDRQIIGVSLDSGQVHKCTVGLSIPRRSRRWRPFSQVSSCEMHSPQHRAFLHRKRFPRLAVWQRSSELVGVLGARGARAGEHIDIHNQEDGVVSFQASCIYQPAVRNIEAELHLYNYEGYDIMVRRKLTITSIYTTRVSR